MAPTVNSAAKTGAALLFIVFIAAFAACTPKVAIEAPGIYGSDELQYQEEESEEYAPHPMIQDQMQRRYPVRAILI